MDIAGETETNSRELPAPHLPDRTEDRSPRRLELLFAAFLIVLVVTTFYRGVNARITDFRVFYTVAQMLRVGAARNIYDVPVQQAFQLRVVNKVGLLFAFPAATALLYFPGAWFSLQNAFLLWTTASVTMLFFASIFLNRALALFKYSSFLFAITLVFPPVWFNLFQGQPVFVVLLAYSLAFCLMGRGSDFAAGSALALGLVKFHLVFPFVFILLLRKRWRALAGFSIASLAFLAICIATVGWQSMANYPRLLLQVPSLPAWGMNIAFAANLRGLFVGFLHHEPPLILAAAVYLAMLVWSARLWTEVDLGFAIAMTATVLVSHHLNPHDLSLLVIPIAVLLKRVPLVSWRSLVLVLVAPPLPLFLLGPHFWLMGGVAVALFVTLVTLQPTRHPRQDAAPACA